MSDITSTSFGLVIAYLLPGLTGFYSAAFWSPTVRALFNMFLTAESNGGRFLVVVLISLIVGLELSVLRWALFEKWICREHCLQPKDFGALSQDSHLNAFRAAVDEHYRYHQFWGAMSFVIPVYVVGYVQTSVCSWPVVFALLGLLVVWAATLVAAKVSWLGYVQRSRSILQEDADAKRVG